MAKDDREEVIDRLTFDVLQGIVRGDKLRSLVRYVFHEGMQWRFNQPDVQAAMKRETKSNG